MNTQHTRRDEVDVLTVQGFLGGAAAAGFRQKANECLQRSGRDFVIDVAAATGADSIGLEALTWLQRTCVERLGLVKLAALPPTLEHILQLTRLDALFDSFWDVDAAVAGLR